MQKEVNEEINIPKTKTWHNDIESIPISNETPDYFEVPSEIIKNDFFFFY